MPTEQIVWALPGTGSWSKASLLSSLPSNGLLVQAQWSMTQEYLRQSGVFRVRRRPLRARARACASLHARSTPRLTRSAPLTRVDVPRELASVATNGRRRSCERPRAPSGSSGSGRSRPEHVGGGALADRQGRRQRMELRCAAAVGLCTDVNISTSTGVGSYPHDGRPDRAPLADETAAQGLPPHPHTPLTRSRSRHASSPTYALESPLHRPSTRHDLGPPSTHLHIGAGSAACGVRHSRARVPPEFCLRRIGTAHVDWRRNGVGGAISAL